MQSGAGMLQRTGPYTFSDPSEKTALSFHFGLMLAKLFAEVLFDVPRMLHFAVYGNQYNVLAAPGDSRPDLIGLSATGDWFVFEAKGRSNGFDSEALAIAKLQAQQIRIIENVEPVCRIASQSYFSTSGMRFRMDDPEANEKHTRNIKITRDQFEAAYYSPIRNMLGLRGIPEIALIDQRRFVGTRIAEADLSIALTEEGTSPVDDRAAIPLVSDQYLGRDGVLVRLGPSWGETNMRLEPSQRPI
jgi:hypothetical protein